MRAIVRTILVALALGVSAGGANATTIVYTDLAAWQAAVSGPVVTTTFEENASGYTFHGGAAVFDGVTYTVNFGSLYTVDPAYGSGYGGIGTGDVLSAQLGASLLEMSFAPTSAFGFDYHSGGGPFMNFWLSNDFTSSISAVAGQVGFLGVVSTDPITSFEIQVPGILNIDNVRVAGGDVQPVPESGSILLLAGPAALALLSMRRAFVTR